MRPPLENAINTAGTVSSQWSLFFKYLWNGDQGQDYTPTATSLTGTATITGRYYRLSKGLYYLRIRVVPATDTSSVAGTTYASFPMTVPAFGNLGVINETTNQSIGTAVITSNGRIYLPTWTTVTAPITISGIIEAQ